MANVKDYFSIDKFKDNFVNGARNYLFYIIPNFPSTGVSMSLDPTYLVRSSSIPGRTVEAIDVPWQGYMYKLGGKSTTEDWTITFVVDKTAKIYKQFYAWTNLVHDPSTNVHGDPKQYMKDQRVQMLSGDGKEAIIEIKLIGAWPTTVSALELSYDSGDVATFDVTFAYLRHEMTDLSSSSGGTGGLAGLLG